MKTVCVILLVVTSTWAWSWEQNNYEESHDVEGSELRLKRSPFREGERQFPGQNQDKKGSWDVSATRDERGPQIKAQGEGNVYSKGNSRVDVGGQWEAGRGRKPSYGVSVKGRWRRSLEEVGNEEDVEQAEDLEQDNEEISRVRRSPFREGERQFPGQNQDKKGSWDVSATRDERGPQIKAQGEGNVYSKGNSRVDVGGQWEAGRGRKPSYGVSVKGRWRRDLTELENQFISSQDEEKNVRVTRQANDPKTTISVSGQKVPGSRPTANVDVNHRIWQSRDKQSSFNFNGNAQYGQGKPQYYGGVVFTRRFRRDLENLENENEGTEEVRVRRQTKDPKTTISVSGQHTSGSRPTANVDVNHRIWQSRDRQSSFNFNGNAQYGQGKPQYYGGVTFTRRFRRDLENIESENEDAEEVRVRRQANDPRTTISVSGQKVPGSRPTANVDVNHRIWQSRDRQSSFNFNGNAQYGQGKPQYYGGVVFTRRFRRDLENLENENEGTEEVRVRRQAKDPKTTISVSGQHTSGSRPTANVDVNHRIWQSRDKQSSFNFNGNAQYGQGKPQYYGGVVFTRRFRRDLENIESENEGAEEVRVRRQAKDPKTTISVSGQHTSGSRPTANVDVNHKIWQSRDKQSSFNFNGNAQYGQGKPQYYGGVTFTKRF